VREDAYAALLEAARFDSCRRSLEALGYVLPRVMQLALLEVRLGQARALQFELRQHLSTQELSKGGYLLCLHSSSCCLRRDHYIIYISYHYTCA
jgi:hypothetical protein